MTNVLDGLTAKLSRVPAAFADEAVAQFAAVAEQVGGRMMGRYQLTATERKRFVYPDGCTLVVAGTPAGFWVWKETGTSAHQIGPRRNRKARSNKRRKGHGATRGHAPTFTGRPARKRRKPKADRGRVYGGYGHPVRRARHPGSTGKRLWTKTVAQATPRLQAALELALAQVVH